MKATITTQSRTLEQILTPEDYGIFRGKYTTMWGAIFHNTGSNSIYIETGKAATTSDSYELKPGSKIIAGFFSDAVQTEFKTATWESELIILF